MTFLGCFGAGTEAVYLVGMHILKALGEQH